MSYELNLNDEQKRRIEGAETPEEKAAIIQEAMDASRKLSDEELDAMSGERARMHRAFDANR